MKIAAKTKQKVLQADEISPGSCCLVEGTLLFVVDCGRFYDLATGVEWELGIHEMVLPVNAEVSYTT